MNEHTILRIAEPLKILFPSEMARLPFGLCERLEAARQSGASVALFIIDLDRFKNLNDTLGHHAGDQLLAELGAGMQRFGGQVLELLGFIGLILETFARSLFHPSRWRVTSLVAQMQATGLNALPIVALLTFLVGCVVAFLGATVLERFGASIYTVALVALAFLREFGVLLTAILLAGRTASAFTAQIGSMKSGEELDAIRTMGDKVEAKRSAGALGLPLVPGSDGAITWNPASVNRGITSRNSTIDPGQPCVSSSGIASAWGGRRSWPSGGH